MKFVRGGRRAWALARRWDVDGRWAECMRVANGQHNPHIRAIRGQRRPTLRSRFVQVITPPMMSELKVWCGVQVGRDEGVRIALKLEHYVPIHRASAAADDDNETTAVLVTLVC